MVERRRPHTIGTLGLLLAAAEVLHVIHPPQGSSSGLPRLHPGITQEVAPNESQRAPKPTTREALIYEALFVAPWFWR
jgi:hypothetical protein